MKILIERLHGRRPDDPGPGENTMVSDGDIIRLIHDICTNQAMAFSCLFDDAKSRPKEPPNQRRLRLERIGSIKKACVGIDVSALANKGVRNALAHFDDRMLGALMNKPGVGFVKNISFYRIPAGLEELPWILVYIFEQDIVYLFEERLHLASLQTAAQQVLDRLGVHVREKEAA